MKANNNTIENALHLAFTPEYVDTFGLVEVVEAWSHTHDARDFDLNLNAYAEKCTYKMEQDGLTLEFDAWDRLTAEIERFAGVWVLLYCNEVSWNNRPEWLANSVRNTITTNNTTPETTDTMNTETMTKKEETKSVNDIMSQANRLMSECNAKRNFKRADAIRKIAFRYFDNIRACAGSFDSNNDAEYNKQYTRAQYMSGAKAVTIEIKPNETGCTATVNGVNVGWVCTWFNNTFAAVYDFGIRTRKGLAMPELDNREEAAHGFMTKANAVLWLGDMITRYFAAYGITANIVNA